MRIQTAFVLAAFLGSLPVLAAEPGAPQQAADKPPIPFAVPRDADMPQGERGEAVMLGRRLMTETKRLLPDNVGDEMNCASCHLLAGKVPFGSPFLGTARAFPQYNPRAGREVTLVERINGCFLRSMNGKPLAPESKEMKAMLAYMDWLSEGLPPGRGKMKIQGKGIGKINTDLIPDPENGRKVYDRDCAVCHGKDGEGKYDSRGEMVFPPLWGDKSFNVGAGMARTYTAAAFVYRNMPLAHGMNGLLGQGGALTEQEAVDVGHFFSHQPRPDFPPKVNDWPKGGKPKDARY
jgi:thiosulfate dehydrogenase